MSKNQDTAATGELNQARQGDIFIERVECIETIAADAVSAVNNDGRMILEFGEVTGHAHRLVGDVESFTKKDNVKFLEICFGKEATIVHEEHGAIKLTPGAYRQIRQETWDSLEQLARKVAD